MTDPIEAELLAMLQEPTAGARNRSTISAIFIVSYGLGIPQQLPAIIAE